MITYYEVKKYILNNLELINKDDFYLLEGKLVFKSWSKALLVRAFFEDKGIKVVFNKTKKWDHWENTYAAELYFAEGFVGFSWDK